MDFTVVHEEAVVPVIDLSPLLDPRVPSPARTGKLAGVRQIGKACEEWGFFQVINHGIPLDLIEEVLATSRIFFEYPAEEKMKVRAQAREGDHSKIPTGYNVYPPRKWDMHENLYNRAGPSECNAFPQDLPQFRMVVEKLRIFLTKTVEFIESLVSQSVVLPPDFLTELNGDRIEPFKLLCYPKATSPHEEIGAWEHQEEQQHHGGGARRKWRVSSSQEWQMGGHQAYQGRYCSGKSNSNFNYYFQNAYTY